MTTKIEVVSMPVRADTTQAELSVTLPTGDGWQAKSMVPYADVRGPAFAVLFDDTDTEAALDARLTALEAVNGIVNADTNAGVGDQIALEDTNPTAFTEKSTIPANTLVADCFLNIDATVWVDGVDSTPQFTVELLVGSTVVDTIVIATAAADDYAVFRERIKCTAVGASLTGEVTSTGILKDGTVAFHGVAQEALAITADSTAAIDITARVTSDAGHASNLCTLRTISHSVEVASA